MKKYGFSVLLMVLIVALSACTEKKTETEYFQQAYDEYNKGEFEKAINSFKLLVEYYPESENSAKSIFMIGFINANHTKNLEEAEKYYKLFLDKYPEHELASSAKYELETLGKDINELPIFKDMESEEEPAEK